MGTVAHSCAAQFIPSVSVKQNNVQHHHLNQTRGITKRLQTLTKINEKDALVIVYKLLLQLYILQFATAL